MNSPRINPETLIGCVCLKVANVERSLGFYQETLGFEVMQWYGEDAVFLSAGGYHHHSGLNLWAGCDVPPAPRNSAGLSHLAILYTERRELAWALRELLDLEYSLGGASDHGVSEALYLRGPDDNGVELYWDRPREACPHDGEGNPAMGTQPFDVRGLHAELDGAARAR